MITKSILIVSLLVFLFLAFLPQGAIASGQAEKLEELRDKLIEVSLAISSLLNQVDEFLNSFSPLYYIPKPWAIT